MIKQKKHTSDPSYENLDRIDKRNLIEPKKVVGMRVIISPSNELEKIVEEIPLISYEDEFWESR